MNDTTPLEEEAILFASRMAGEYLDSLRTTDLSRFTPEQWDKLLKVICLNYDTFKMSNTLSTVMFQKGEQK